MEQAPVSLSKSCLNTEELQSETLSFLASWRPYFIDQYLFSVKEKVYLEYLVTYFCI